MINPTNVNYIYGKTEKDTKSSVIARKAQSESLIDKKRLQGVDKGTAIL